MITQDIALHDQKCFIPSEKLTQYIRDRLQLAKEMEDLDAAEKEFPTEIDKRDRSLRTKKTRILDEIIFPAMADLTYFFKMVGQYPDLQILFENDTKDLLGIRRNKPLESMYGFAFFDLLCGILQIGGSRYNQRTESKKDDFRLRLNDLLQRIVCHKISASLTDVIKTEGARKSVLGDFERSISWTGALAYGIDQNAEKEAPTRTFSFDMGEP